MSVAYEQPRADAPTDFQRIYVGSLDYFAKPADVESLLQETGLDHKKIHISIDPISGRNPGYCFVEFGTHEEAANSLDVLAGKAVLGRTVKLGPCVPKTGGQHNGGARLSEHKPTFQRWGDWNGERNGNSSSNYNRGPRGDQQGPDAAMERVERPDGFRVRVDGLNQMVDQLQNDEEIRGLFEGFDVVAIGKRVIPYSLRGTPGNHHHCFVDFATKQEADRAVAELNGTPFEDGHLKVSLARNNQHRNHNQSRDTRGPRSESQGEQQQERRQPQNSEKRNNIMEARSWRRAAE
ncbi:hypothetical protein QBC35DRAFT_527295 [Podospora australis]|uniref:RRM domain-containing protein n=1 Tax=Podospora australis TaxID=1536484 RepID=A0AAN7AP30_9PEZI|nr:hypothetical protein QBC35DRAFT_527295 [Podospora australis]